MKDNTMTLQPMLKTLQGEECIALEGVRIRSRLVGIHQDVTVEQRFRNEEDVSIEAVYTFPLSDKAVVRSFEVRKSCSFLVGEIEATEEAQDRYQDALDDGDSAYLLESHRPDVFSAHVGNLGPRESVIISVGYLETLQPMDDEIRLSFPTTIAPRYVPVAKRDVESVLDGDMVNPPHVAQVPYGLDFELVAEPDLPLDSAESSSHTVETTCGEDGVTTIRLLHDEESAMDRDLILNLKLLRQEEPHAISSGENEEDSYLSVTFFPEFESGEKSPPPSETVFLIDASGSMGGSSYEQARDALGLCLRSLREGDTFNLIRFGSTFDSWRDTPQTYSEKTLREALVYLDKSEADLGGTEIEAPLAHLFAQPVRTGEARQVIILTDGQVSNEHEVHELARKHAAQNRIFTFGIGAASSRNLVNGLAEATAGAPEYIQEGERIEPKVLRVFSRIASPRISNLKLTSPDKGAARFDLAPGTMPPIFDGDAITLHARIKGKLPGKVTLSGEGPDGPVSWISRIIPASGQVAEVPCLTWASRKIRELETGIQSTGNFILARKGKKRRAKIIELSKKHGLLSSLTNFVAVEHRSPEERLQGQPALRRIPVQLARGWGQIEKQEIDRDLIQYEMMSPPVACSSPSINKMMYHPVARSTPSINPPPPACPAFFESSRSSLPGHQPVERYLQVLHNQNADGSFTLDLITDEDRKEIEAALSKLAKELDPKIREKVVHTLCALQILKDCHPDIKQLVGRAVQKATEFLQKHLKPDELTTIRETSSDLTKAT